MSTTEPQTVPMERKNKYIAPGEYWEEENQVLPSNYRETTAKQVEDLEIYDDDVWVITIPKSGTHWMQETVCCLLHGMDFDKLRSPDYQRSYNIELQGFEAFQSLQLLHLKHGSEHSETLERPRVMKTHLFWDRLPKALRDPNSKAKIIYVARNPKDVCISGYYFYQMLHGEGFQEASKSLDFYANEFMNDRLPFTPYWPHLYDFWNRRNDSRVLFVKFEEMKADFSKVLDKLQVFLNLNPLTQEQKQAVTDYVSFDKMKKNDALNDYMHLHGKVYRKEYSNIGGEAKFMRKGQVGGWKKEMSPELAKKFDEWILKNTAGTGYSIDID